jgi:hypothetical protein
VKSQILSRRIFNCPSKMFVSATDINDNEVCIIAQNTLRKYVYSKLEYSYSFLLSNDLIWPQVFSQITKLQKLTSVQTSGNYYSIMLNSNQMFFASIIIIIIFPC